MPNLIVQSFYNNFYTFDFLSFLKEILNCVCVHSMQPKGYILYI